MKDIFNIILHIIKANKDIFYRILIRTIFYTVTLLAAMHMFSASDEETEDEPQTSPESVYTDE